MSDIDTYPLHSNPYNDGFILPNDGKFTCYDRFVPSLVSGSKSEWERMSQLMLSNYLSHSKSKIHWSDMFAMREIRNTETYISMQDIIEIQHACPESNQIDSDQITLPHECCPSLKNKRAVHFSHNGCEKAGFCHNKRSEALGKWMEAWHEQCL